MAGRARAVAALVGIASLALVAPAAAAKSKQAKFKVEVFAEQHIDWTYDVTQTDDCTGGSYRQFGSGGQSFSLTTKKPVKVTALSNKFGGTRTTAIFAGKLTDPKTGLPVNVAAIQEGNITTQQITPGDGEACGDGGGGGAEPPAPDCGERSFNAEVRLAHYEPELYPGDPAPLVPVLTVSGPFDSDSSRPLHEQWERCPGPANDSGGLMETATGGLPPAKLFGKKKKFTVKAKDSDVFTSDSTRQTTKMNWTVEFKRLRG